MNSDQVTARLNQIFPSLDWAATCYDGFTEHNGYTRDGRGQTAISLTHWGTESGSYANRVDLWTYGIPSREFPGIESAVYWLEQFQLVNES